MSARNERWLVVVAGAVALGAACSAPGGATGQQPAAPAATGQPAAGQASADCWVGTHQVRSITGRQAVDTPLGPAKPVGSGGSLRLELGGDGQWTLSSDGSAPVVFDVGGISVNAGINGSVRGSYSHAGAQFAFQQRGGEGSVVLTTAAGARNLPITTLGPALAPGGAGTLTCQPDKLVLDSASVQMELAPTPGATAGGPAPAPPAQAPPAASAPPAANPPPAASPLVLAQSAQTTTTACAGRVVTIRGSGNTAHLTGDCPSLEIVGSQNTVTIDRTDGITITGSFNRVSWSSGLQQAQPAVHSNGTGNSVQHA